MHIEGNENIHEISVEDSIGKIKMDSLIFMKIIISIEDEFHIEFDFDRLDLNTFQTVKDLSDYVYKKIQMT